MAADKPKLTQAQRAYARLEPDRAKILAELEEKATRTEDSVTLAQLAKIAASGMTIDQATVEMYSGLAAELSEAMRELGFDVSGAVVGSTVSTELTAQVQGFPDGSALISVSDGIMTLGIHYGHHVARRMSDLTRSSFLKRLASVVEMFTGVDSGLDRTLLAGALRYYNVHQRVFGESAMVTIQLDDHQERIANGLCLHSMRFVVAHELAHYALGHLEEGQASPHRSAQDDVHRETDADLLAFRATRLAAQRSGMTDQSIIGLGVLLSIATLHCGERALFVRTGTTHPPTLERGALVLAELPAPRRASAQLLFDDMIKATDVAADFSPGPPRVDWWGTLKHPEIYTPHPTSYLKQIIQLDMIQSCALNDLAQTMKNLDEKHGTATHEGARAVLAGDPAGALAAWGVRDDLLQNMTDPGSALTFSGLRECLQTSMFGAAELGETTRRLWATAAASLIQASLRETDAHGG